jgi:hypothetical protein
MSAVHHGLMEKQAPHPIEVFVPASDADLEAMAAEEMLVPYQAGGIVLSQVFRECRGVDPLPPAAGPLSRGAAKARRRG